MNDDEYNVYIEHYYNVEKMLHDDIMKKVNLCTTHAKKQRNLIEQLNVEGIKFL